jgi:hypothetical protein
MLILINEELFPQKKKKKNVLNFHYHVILVL